MPLLRHVTDLTMLHYWSRDIRAFRQDREQLLKAWPKDVPIPAELRRLVPPAFVLRLMDRFRSSGLTHR